jgi:ABC-type glycerol-3-phosphate transport system permease component
MDITMTRTHPLSSRKLVRRSLSYGVLILVTLLISIPFIYLLITSLKQDVEYNAWPIRFFPAVPQWGNYAEVFAPSHHILRYAGNTLFLALVSTGLSIVSSSMGGFAFSRFSDVPGRNKLFSIIIALIILPGTITVIPQFIVFSRIGITNTYWPWILWGVAGSAYSIFMFRQFFLTFPTELEDAAEVDGCNPFRIYWQIFLPNCKPALATAFIQGFSGVWGDWFTPVIYLSHAKTTLPVVIAGAFKDPAGNTLVTVTLAASVIYTLPLIVMFFLGQQHILKGVVTSGLKG